MTSIQIRQIITDVLASNLPGLLAGAGLDNFNEYIAGPTKDEQKKECASYLEFEGNSTDQRVISFIIQCQLPSILDPTLYHAIILPVIQEFLSAGTVGMETRESIEGDVWPCDVSRSTSFIYYSLTYSQSLDDCDD